MWVAKLLALTDWNTLIIGVTVPFFGLLSPLILAWLVARNNRKDKEIEWARQDQIEAKLLARQTEVDEKTDKIARQLESTTETTSRKLHVIHGLVNSQMTEVLRSELAAIKHTVSLMKDLIEAQRRAGVEPTIEMLSNLTGREARIRELEDMLRAREAEDDKSAQEEG